MTAAARLRSVSRPAIADLVRRGRLHGYQIGERQLVSKSEVLAFKPKPIGRPKKKKLRRKSKIGTDG
jgi:excisionase family DNA binding protein